MKKMILLIIVAGLIFMVDSTLAQENEDVIIINSTYEHYGLKGDSDFWTGDGLRYSFRDDGIVEVRNQASRMVSSFGLGLDGGVYDVVDNDFSWNWDYVSELIDEEIGEETYRYTKHKFIGYNNNPALNITQVYEMYPHKDTKLTTYFTNNGFAFANPNLKYIIRFPMNEYYTVEGDSINFRYGATFDYSDVTASNDVNSTYDFDSVVLNVPIASFGAGQTLVLDPIFTGYKNPGAMFNNNGWTNPTNVASSDNNYATSTSTGSTMNMSQFSFGVPPMTAVTGVIVRGEGKGGVPPCSIGASASASVRFTNVSMEGNPDGTWVDWRGFPSAFLCSSFDSIKTLGSDGDVWGMWEFDSGGTWETAFNDSNLVVQLEFTSALRGGNFNPGIDHFQMALWYRASDPNITFTDPTPLNNSLINSTFYVNVSSDLPLVDAFVRINVTGEYVNYTLEEETDFIWSLKFEGLDLDSDGFLSQGANNGSGFDFRVYGNASGNETFTVDRRLEVNSTLPEVVINSPFLNSINSSTNRTLSWNTTDIESDSFDTLIYTSFNDSSFDEANLINRTTNLDNGTFSMNLLFGLPEINDNNLYAYYKHDRRFRFGENETLTLDWKNRRLNGTTSYVASDPPLFSVGKMLGGYLFDGSDDSIQIGNESDFANVCVNNECSFSIWQKSFATLEKTVIGRWDTTNNDRFIRFESSRNDILLRIGNGSTQTCVGSVLAPELANNEWGVDTATYNGTAICMYRNGTLIECDTCNNFNSVTLAHWLDSDEGTFIGGYDGGSAGEFAGTIDEVAIWNKSLTSEEVRNLGYLRNGTHYWTVKAYDSPLGEGSATSNFTVGAEVVEDSCTYVSGNFNVDCWDNCSIVSDIAINTGSNVSIVGAGTFTVDGANITGFNIFEMIGESATNRCEGFVINGGQIG